MVGMAATVSNLVFQWMPILLLAALILVQIAAAQSTVTVTSKTDTGTTTVTTSAAPLTNCDGVGTFFCPTGTCYTGQDGFIGCCTVSSCAARTTCIPYTANFVQTCNADTGGCVVCSSAVPSCVTIENVAMSQYIMYCDALSTVITLSYTNLITGGSTALPPASNSDSSASVTSKNSLSPSSTTSNASLTAAGTPITFHTAAAIQSNTTPEYSGLSRGAVAGITVSCVIVVAGAIIAFMIMLRKRHKIHQQSPNEISGPFNEPQNIPDRLAATEVAEQSGTASPRRLQKIPGLRGRGPMFSRMDDNHRHEYLSPVAGNQSTNSAEGRDAERIHELNGIPTPTTTSVFYSPEFSPETSQDVRSSWWTPQTKHGDDSDPQTQGFTNNAHSSYNPYRPNLPANEIAELPTVRQVQPSGSHDAVSPSSIYPASPDPNTHLISPMVGSASPHTPLMSKWHTSDRASVGQNTPDPSSIRDPTAMLPPIKRTTVPCLIVRTDEVHTCSRVGRSLTSATGGSGRYVTPEMAMMEGLDGGEGEGVEEGC